MMLLSFIYYRCRSSGFQSVLLIEPQHSKSLIGFNLFLIVRQTQTYWIAVLAISTDIFLYYSTFRRCLASLNIHPPCLLSSFFGCDGAA